MPSFATISNRLTNALIGFAAGEREQDERLRTERLAGLKLALDSGAAGLDLTPHLASVLSPQNKEFAQTALVDATAAGKKKYDRAVDAERAKQGLEIAKLKLDLVKIKSDQDVKLALQQSQNDTRLMAAQISALPGLINATTGGPINDYKVIDQAIRSRLNTMVDDKGNRVFRTVFNSDEKMHVPEADFEDAYWKSYNEIRRDLERYGGFRSAAQLNSVLNDIFTQRQYKNTGGSGGWFGFDPKIESRPLADEQIGVLLGAARDRLLQISNPSERSKRRDLLISEMERRGIPRSLIERELPR